MSHLLLRNLAALDHHGRSELKLCCSVVELLLPLVLCLWEFALVRLSVYNTKLGVLLLLLLVLALELLNESLRLGAWIRHLTHRRKSIVVTQTLPYNLEVGVLLLLHPCNLLLLLLLLLLHLWLDHLLHLVALLLALKLQSLGCNLHSGILCLESWDHLGYLLVLLEWNE